jgi:hypothetical protein
MRLGCSDMVSCFIFILLISLRLYLYSQGIHTSDLPQHYTIFVFEKKGGRLEQRWSLHINEDGSLNWVRSKKRRIFLNSVTRLFVRYFFIFFTKYFKIIEYLFFQG